MKTSRAAWAISLAAALPASAQPWFRSIAFVPGDNDGTAYGLSADGLFAVGSSNKDQTSYHAYRWTLGGGVQPLGTLPGGVEYSIGLGVSAHGFHVVGGSASASGVEAFRWQGGVMTGLGDLPGSEFSSEARAVCADGSVVVGRGQTGVGGMGHRQAARSVRGGPLESLGHLDGGDILDSYAFGISADGTVIVGSCGSTPGAQAYRWTAGTGMVGLGDLAGGVYSSTASGLSADGSVVVGSSESASGPQAFRWTASSGMTGLGDLSGGAFISGAQGASADGSIVVGYGRVEGDVFNAFIWDAQHGMRNLRQVLIDAGATGLQDWTLNLAYAVSGDGLTIAGYGQDPEGFYRGWVAYLGQPFTRTTERVSVSYAEQQGNAGSTQGSVSNDGQVIAFWSNAANLVAGDTNAKRDVFVRNRAAGWTTRVSLSTAGAQANGDSIDGQISGDGRYVVFASDATNLVAGDTNGARDIFLRDRVAGATTRLSISSAGAQASGPSNLPRISSDGRFIAFESDATNLVAGDTNQRSDVFLRDRQNNSTTRVSINSAGVQANGASSDASLADNGLTVAFTSDASNLAPGDSNGSSDVFFRNRSTNSTVRVSVSSAGAQGNLGSSGGHVSANGRYIAFTSSASNLVVGDTNAADDVFVRDRNDASTTRITLAPNQSNGDSAVGAISANGRFILYNSYATNLVAGDTNSARDAFVHDNWTFLTQRASLGNAGQQAASACVGTALSADGRCAIFNSIAGNLVPGDNAGFSDVFLRDLHKPE